MEKEFVPYELAVKLKALGFDEPCFTYYYEDTGKIRTGLSIHIHNGWTYSGTKTLETTLAPTFSQAFRWFRDTHNLIHEIQIDRTSQPKFCYAILQYEHYGNYEEIRIREWYLYRTYEEAELACLENLIEVVESKSE